MLHHALSRSTTIGLLATLCAGTAAQSAGNHPILTPPRITQAMITSGSLSLETIRTHGLRMFSAPFNKLDGYGDGPVNPLDTTTPGGRPTLQNTARSCASTASTRRPAWSATPCGSNDDRCRSRFGGRRRRWQRTTTRWRGTTAIDVVRFAAAMASRRSTAGSSTRRSCSARAAWSSSARR